MKAHTDITHINFEGLTDEEMFGTIEELEKEYQEDFNTTEVEQ